MIRATPCTCIALAALFATGLFAPVAGAGTLPVREGPGGKFDLPISGLLEGLPAGTQGHLDRSDLLALPTTVIDVTGKFGSEAKDARVLFLSDLVAALPAKPGANVLLASCTDGYLSVYTFDFIRRYRPYLVLEIAGRGPEHWPPPGLAFNPAPFAIDASASLAPGVEEYRDIGHKRPWGVVSIRLSSMPESFGAFFQGRWASPSPAAAAGREIWINSCASCHPGAGGATGGTKSGRPMEIVQAIAGANRAFFMQYVRNPTSLDPRAKMEPHPWYSDAELDQLIEFLTAPAAP
jgi:hypothetical protein